MTHWYVGQKVQCIADWEGPYLDKHYPENGSVYTIEHIEPRFYKGEEQIGFLLLEISNPPRWLGAKFMEIAFAATGFRPLVNTDISVFEKMLAKKPRKKSAPSPKQRVDADA